MKWKLTALINQVSNCSLTMQRMYCNSVCILITMTLLSWELAAMSSLASCEAVHVEPDEGQSLQYFQHVFQANQEIKEKASKRPTTPGSKPPNCEHKCRGCKPCTAVQVPEPPHHSVVECANYEPEGWICKCGSSFFIP